MILWLVFLDRRAPVLCSVEFVRVFWGMGLNADELHGKKVVGGSVQRRLPR